MPRLLTQAQYARKTKYSRARITQLVKQGVIILKNGKVDPAQAETAIAANIDRSRRERAEKKAHAARTPQMGFIGNGFNNDPSKGTSLSGFNNEPGNGKGYEGQSLTEVRRDLEMWKIKKMELDVKAKSGQLVPKNEAIKMVIALGAAIKLAFLNLPRRLADILAAMTDSKEIEILLRSEIKTIIRTLEQSHDAKSKRVRAKNPKRGMADHLATAR